MIRLITDERKLTDRMTTRLDIYIINYLLNFPEFSGSLETINEVLNDMYNTLVHTPWFHVRKYQGGFLQMKEKQEKQKKKRK